MRATILFVSGIWLGIAGAAAQEAAPAAAPPEAVPATAMPPAPLPVPAPGNPAMTGPQLLIQTSMGDIVLQLDNVRAPASVANVLSYARSGHYNGTIIYRVVKGFVIQMGSWEVNGKGRGYFPKAVALEANNGLKNYRGAVALPRGEVPTSAGPDFFIDLGNNIALDRKPDDAGNTTGYAVFGQVASGMDVVEAIAQVAVGGGKGPMPESDPMTPIVITRVSVVGDPPPRPAAAAKPGPATAPAAAPKAPAKKR